MALEKALVLHQLDPVQRQQIEAAAAGRYAVTFREPDWTEARLLAELEEAAAVLGDVGPARIPRCKKLKWLQITWAGVEDYLRTGYFPRDAELCCMTGAFGQMIAEYVLAVLLSVNRRLPAYEARHRAHVWQFAGYDRTLEDAAVLILGAGDLGSAIARCLRPLAGRILGLRRSEKPNPDFDEVASIDRLEEFLPRADVVICCMPHTPQTKGMLDARRLWRMKADAVLINVGRGSLIPLEDLGQVLQEGHLRAAVLDVTDPEPVPPDHPIWQAPRLLITPHVSGGYIAPNSPTDRRIRAFLVENFARHCQGLPCKNVVDMEKGYRK